MASAAWSTAPKKIDASIGFIRLNNNIDVEVLTDQIITKVAGEWKARFLPNVSFALTMQDLMSLQMPDPGALAQLEASTTSELSPNASKYGFLVSLISPLFGGLILWQGDPQSSLCRSPVVC